MCRSSNEPGGPRRCPSHAHARFADALAEVLALERRELELYREASKHAADLMVPTSRAHRWYRDVNRDVEQMRAEYGDRSDFDTGGYREAYRDMLAAKREADRSALAERQALELVQRRRRSATEVLQTAGICSEEADRVITAIDRDTALEPPF